jgi:hypothetical protein
LEFDSDDGGVGVNSLLPCIHPTPVDSSKKSSANTSDQSGESSADQEQDVGADELSTIGDEVGSSSPLVVDTTFSFECKVVSSNANSHWAVERVTILSSRIERTASMISALLFDVEVSVRGDGIRK